MSKQDKLIEQTNLLGGKYQEDCLGYREHARKVLGGLSVPPENSLIALVGARGAGKSFLTREMEKINNEGAPNNSHWLHFDVDDVTEPGDLWPSFMKELNRVLKLNFWESFWPKLRLIVKDTQKFIFGGRSNYLTTALSIFILSGVFLIIYMIGQLLFALAISIFLALVIFAPAYIPLALKVINGVRKKLNPEGGRADVGELLINIEISKKHTFVVVDNITSLGRNESILLEKIRRLLDRLNRNKVGKGVKVIVPTSGSTLAGLGRSSIWQHFDHLEFFQPELPLDKIIKKLFIDGLLEKKGDRARCRRVFSLILEATGQNLHILKLIIVRASRRRNELGLSESASLRPFSCLVASSVEVLRVIELGNDCPDSRKSIKRTADKIVKI